MRGPSVARLFLGQHDTSFDRSALGSEWCPDQTNGETSPLRVLVSASSRTRTDHVVWGAVGDGEVGGGWYRDEKTPEVRREARGGNNKNKVRKLQAVAGLRMALSSGA